MKNIMKIGILLLLSVLVFGLLGLSLPAFAEDGTFYPVTVSVEDAYSADSRFSVSVELLTGTQNQAGEYSMGATVRLSASCPSGYKFSGWYNSLGNKESDSAVLNDKAVNQAVVYEARFACEEYAIVYADSSLYSFPMGMVSKHEYGTPTTVTNPSRGGYTFAGWLIAGKTTQPQISLTLGAFDYTEDITLQATWTPNKYTVIREDYKYNSAFTSPSDYAASGVKLGQVTWLADMASTAYGSEGGEPATAYIGYHYVAGQGGFTQCLVTITDDNTNTNVIQRYYIPMEYAIIFDLGGGSFDAGVTAPGVHVYDTETDFDGEPVRVGYTFCGWQINGAKATDAGETLVLGATAYTSDITVSAIWSPNVYTISYALGGGVIDSAKPIQHTFGTPTQIPQIPTRTGYTFAGWTVNDAGSASDPATLFVLAADGFTADIALTANWTANQYVLTLSASPADVAGKAVTTATFASRDYALQVSELPQRTGYTFRGYFTEAGGAGIRYIGEDGTALADWDISQNTTLFAHWTINSYSVTVTANFVDISINGEALSQKSYDFGTEITVLLNAKQGYKLVSVDGTAISHVKTKEISFVLGAGDKTLSAVSLPMASVPAVHADYLKEVFVPDTAFPAGAYLFSVSGISDTVSFTVDSAGSMTRDSALVSSLAVPEPFWGKTVLMTALGDGVNSSDGDPLELVLSARPKIPEINREISAILQGYTDISVRMEEDGYTFEFAISTGDSPAALVWQTASSFSSLHQGTYYYVFIRVAAKAGNYPHGSVFCQQTNTYFEDYLMDAVNRLEAMKAQGGEITAALLDGLILQARALVTPSATFYTDLQGILNSANMRIGFTSYQDQCIEKLDALLASLIATGEYSEGGASTLCDLCASSQNAIRSAAADKTVENLFNSGCSEMENVKIVYLYAGDDRVLEARNGLPRKIRWGIEEKQDLDSLADAVDEAIRSGACSVSGRLSGDALERVKTLDLMAAYRMMLTQNGNEVNIEGNYTVSLILPQALWRNSGIQVGYYDELTGSLVLLPTTVGDHHELTFEASSVSDFVILGDPTYNVTAPIVALAVLVLLQLVAIIYFLMRRRSNSRKFRHASFLPLPAFLTVCFTPANGMLWLIVLGVLSVVLQVILLYLILSSDVIRRKKGEDNPIGEETAENGEEVPPTDDADSDVYEVESPEEPDFREAKTSDFGREDGSSEGTGLSDENAKEKEPRSYAAKGKGSFPDFGALMSDPDIEMMDRPQDNGEDARLCFDPAVTTRYTADEFAAGEGVTDTAEEDAEVPLDLASVTEAAEGDTLENRNGEDSQGGSFGVYR